MTILEAITRVQSLRPSQYDETLMVRWLSDLDGLIYQEYIKWHEKPKQQEAEEEREEEVFPEKKPLEDMAWADVVRVANAGKAKEYFARRDTKTLVFSEPVLGSESVTVEIAAFDYDDLSDGSGKAPITFLMKNAFANAAAMHSSGEDVLWFDTQFYTMVLPGIRNAITDAVGDGVISPIIKRSYNRGGGAEDSGAVTVWQPSIFEAAQLYTPEEAPLGIDYCYPVFDPFDPQSRIKYSGDSELAIGWWTRTPNGVGSYCFINDDGDATMQVVPTAQYGIVVGFCVGKKQAEEEKQEEREKWPYDPELDMDKDLLVPDPYSDLYVKYLAAQVDYFNGELDRYTNSMILYNKALSDYANWFNRENMPNQANYVQF